MKKTTLFLILASLASILPLSAQAHPGRKASDGCHYCRTNCDYWGEAWNERHCHGGDYAPPATQVVTPSVPVPTPVYIPVGAREEKGEVIKVTDGDTIKVSIGGVIQNVRLIGIDTPETVHPSKPVQCFGKEASAYLSSLLSGQTVTLKKDKIGDTIDKYGRLLRYVELDGVDINGKMVREGYAYAYTTYPFDNKNLYLSYQSGSRINKKGLWGPGVCDIEDGKGGKEVVKELPKEEEIGIWGFIKKILKF